MKPQLLPVLLVAGYLMIAGLYGIYLMVLRLAELLGPEKPGKR